MSNIYLEYHFTITQITQNDLDFQNNLGNEILIAELAELPFESFAEHKQGLKAYIQKKFWNENILENLHILKSIEFKISFSFTEINQINWNEEWEKNFNPIDIDQICHIRAPFHPKTDAKFDIIIEPKMSFGTGHHETTNMMIQQVLKMDLKGLHVLDMGCGTAVLAILARLKGAYLVDAVDNDNWCYLNAIENVARNNCNQINVLQGDASLLKDKKYDLIMANINRNILLNDMQFYVNCLNPKGLILISGFYQEDVEIINQSCFDKGLICNNKVQLNNWVSLKYNLK